MPNWLEIRNLVAMLGRDDSSDARIRAQVLEHGTAAIRPLMGLCTRGLPECEKAETILPLFGMRLFEATLQEGAESDSMFVVGCRTSARLGEMVLPAARRLLEEDPLGRRGHLGKCVLVATQGLGVPTLIEIVNTSANQQARGVAMTALAEIDDPRAKDALLRGVSGESGVRQAAARGLIRFPDQRAGPDLLNMMEDEKLGIARESALGALGGIYQPHMRNRVAIVAWRDPASLIRQGAANVLSGSQDRIAQRLGARYYASYYESTDFLAYYYWAGRFGLTAVALCFIAAAGSRSHLKKSLLFATLGGIYWGFFATDVWLQQELRLLGLFVPVALALAWKFGLNDAMLMNVGLGWLGLTFVLRFSMILVPIIGLAGIAPAGYGPTVLLVALPFLAHRFRTRETEQLAQERASVVRTAATFYLSYAISFAALWGYFGF